MQTQSKDGEIHKIGKPVKMKRSVSTRSVKNIFLAGRVGVLFVMVLCIDLTSHNVAFTLHKIPFKDEHSYVSTIP